MTTLKHLMKKYPYSIPDPDLAVYCFREWLLQKRQEYDENYCPSQTITDTIDDLLEELK